ncbi:hypothetical protein AAFF_G00300540 [Aldrovandia affinis]|uniref:Uncharacterized protein n=1 Tax=Aldrovandia affinis TaxID=143900 RepID=A0AAD7SPZ0_9TELE|nr:hypothetical protein AAFF_G00300540 [Aldrovandia affinis]
MEQMPLRGPEGTTTEITIDTIENGDWLVMVYDEHWWLVKAIAVTLSIKMSKWSSCIPMVLQPIFIQNLAGKMFASYQLQIFLYTEEVRSRFQLLDEGLEPSSEYRRFVVANEEATRLCVPMLDKTRTSLQSRHPDVVVARGRVEEARLGYVREPTVERRGILNEAKQLLFSTYDKIKGEELMERVQRVQAAQGERQYGEAWMVINEMTGRKRTKEGQNLNIDDGPFTTSEFARAKTTLREGKSAGPDGIPPEVLKNCGLNNIILQFCNLALLSNKQPDMWSLSNIIRCLKLETSRSQTTTEASA